jgi:hypothetical protein
MGHLVECADEQGHEQVIGLENLYRRARRIERAEWPQLIAEFLRTASAAQQEENLPTDLATVTDKLLVRLGQPLPLLSDDAKVWSQALADTGLGINLVIDYPNRMCYVTEPLVRDSNRPGEEWLERALANLQARTPADALQIIDEETGIRLCSVSDSYDSSRALLLDRLLPESTMDGYFVAVPGRDQLLVLPVTLDALSSVHLLKVLAEKNYKSEPYPISDEVFWVQGGVWRIFEIDIRGQDATIQPPEEFIAVLKRLDPEWEAAASDETSDTGENP